MVLLVCLDFVVISVCFTLYIYCFLHFFLIELASISTVFPPKKLFSFACSSIFYFKLTSTCFYFYKFLSSASLRFVFPFLIYDTQICYSFRFTVRSVQSAQIVILMWFLQSSFPCL